MLRTFGKYKRTTFLLQTATTLQQAHQRYKSSSSGLKTQAKVFNKLFGQRVKGSKKRWYPDKDSQLPNVNAMPTGLQLGQTKKYQGKEIVRRSAVLNKLFMQHITDLMATGEVSEKLLGRGLQVTRVKISSDFASMNVYWARDAHFGTPEQTNNETEIESELQVCSGVLRHELSQLRLMGEVPRIHFVRDKLHSNQTQVEELLTKLDLGEDYDPVERASEDIKNELFHRKLLEQQKLPEKLHVEAQNVEKETQEEPCLKPQSIEELDAIEEEEQRLAKLGPNPAWAPVMRHDVFGLDRQAILNKILAKMRRSKQAWELHAEQQKRPSQPGGATTHTEKLTENSTSTIEYPRLERVNKQLEADSAKDAKLKEFLANQRERRNTPERKKFRSSNSNLLLDDDNRQQWDELPVEEPEDYILEDDNDLSKR